jgi:hypothetical protein
LPGQRGNVSLSDLEVNNAALCVSKRSQGFPKRLGDLHTIDTRMNRWTKVGVLARMFEKLQRAHQEQNGSARLHKHQGYHDGTGALEMALKHQQAQRQWNTKIHMIGADALMTVSLCTLGEHTM